MLKKTRPDRRRSQRVHIIIPVSVYGNRAKGDPFQEEAQTLTVNAHGALINLANHVSVGQELLLINAKTAEKVECTVVQAGESERGKARVRVKFSHSSPRFWGLVFPPEDWNPSERKRPEPHRC